MVDFGGYKWKGEINTPQAYITHRISHWHTGLFSYEKSLSFSGGGSVEAFPHNVIPLPALRIVGIHPEINVLHKIKILIMNEKEPTWAFHMKRYAHCTHLWYRETLSFWCMKIVKTNMLTTLFLFKARNSSIEISFSLETFDSLQQDYVHNTKINKWERDKAERCR